MRKLLSIIALLSLAATFGAVRLTNLTQAKVTTIASLPAMNVSQVAVGGRGKFIYLTTPNGVVLYDRTKKKSRIIAKGNFSTASGSPSGDWLVLLRATEAATPANDGDLPWILPLDPVTGAAAGVPRRVSMTPAIAMRISPDEKQIAFITGGPDHRIMLVPVNGGVEKMIARGSYWAPIRWSPDGKSIYATLDSDKGNRVERVSISTGTSAAASPETQEATPGLTPDGRYVIVQSGGKALNAIYTVFDTNQKRLGDVGVRIPQGDWIDDAWMNDGYHWVAAMWTASIVVHSGDYRGGTSRVIPGIGSEDASLSPDGSLIFSQEPDPSGVVRYVIRNANGSNPKVLGSVDRFFGSVLSTPWSPDSRYVLFRADSGRSLMSYDAREGRSRQIAHSEGLLLQPHWRSDSKAVLYTSLDGQRDQLKSSLAEASLDGRSRILRDMTSEANKHGGVPPVFLTDSITYDRPNGTVTSIGGGIRKLFDAPPLNTTGSAFLPSVSPDGRWLARTAIDRKGIDIVAMDGSVRRTIPVSLPFISLPVSFHPNGREVVVPVKSSGKFQGGFMSVPLDGGTPRRILAVGENESLAWYSISADGKTIIYTTNGAQRTLLVDIDFSPGISALK